MRRHKLTGPIDASPGLVWQGLAGVERWLVRMLTETYVAFEAAGLKRRSEETP